MEQGFDGCHIQDSKDPFIKFLNKVIRISVRCLAVLMTLVIVWGILDVLWVLYQRLVAPPYMLLQINDILATFGAFMAVLIAIEIFANIVMYLQEDIIHIRLVLATALMAAARKAIVLDFEQVEFPYVAALAAIIISLGVSYWLLAHRRICPIGAKSGAMPEGIDLPAAEAQLRAAGGQAEPTKRSS